MVSPGNELVGWRAAEKQKEGLFTKLQSINRPPLRGLNNDRPNEEYGRLIKDAGNDKPLVQPSLPDLVLLHGYPAVETPGYRQPSLRDEGVEILVALVGRPALLARQLMAQYPGRLGLVAKLSIGFVNAHDRA